MPMRSTSDLVPFLKPTVSKWHIVAASSLPARFAPRPTIRKEKIMHPRLQDETTLTMLFVRSRKGQYHLALIPAGLDGDQAERGLRELGIAPAQVCEISRWRTSEEGVTVAALPSPPMN